MTKQSNDPRAETPFSDWLRRHGDLEATMHKLAVTDCDYIVRKTKSQKTMYNIRAVECLMMIELKTYSAELSVAQRRTLTCMNVMMRHTRDDGRRMSRTITIDGRPVAVYSFGVYVLTLDGTRPDNCERMFWQRVDDEIKHEIGMDDLLNLLRFVNDPDDPCERWNPRHDVNRPTRSLDLPGFLEGDLL